ncbi:MAG: TetR/AcrR family transcriptional regulator [Terriglobales bacterium]
MARKPPQPGSKGTQTQAEILSQAVKIASVEGLAGLTIGRLAEELKMSKSGLFAHFRSKQRLELATIDRAWEIFANEVLVPANAAREGIEQLWGLCDLWIRRIERHVFRGSYFFTGAFFEYAGRYGPVPNRVTKVVREWFGTLKDSVRAAQKQDEIKPDADAERISYQLDGLLVGAYWAHLQGGSEAFREARSAILRLLASEATEELPSGAFASLRAWRKFLAQRDQ